MLARAIREGVGHDGRALFGIMPYPHYRNMPDEDLASIIVYLRTLRPVKNPLPKTEIFFPVNYIMRNDPKPITGSVASPGVSDPVKRGRFLVNLTGCAIVTLPSTTTTRRYRDWNSQEDRFCRRLGGQSQVLISRRILRESHITMRRCSSRPCAPGPWKPAAEQDDALVNARPPDGPRFGGNVGVLEDAEAGRPSRGQHRTTDVLPPRWAMHGAGNQNRKE